MRHGYRPRSSPEHPDPERRRLLLTRLMRKPPSPRIDARGQRKARKRSARYAAAQARELPALFPGARVVVAWHASGHFAAALCTYRRMGGNIRTDVYYHPGSARAGVALAFDALAMGRGEGSDEQYIKAGPGDGWDWADTWKDIRGMKNGGTWDDRRYWVERTR